MLRSRTIRASSSPVWSVLVLVSMVKSIGLRRFGPPWTMTFSLAQASFALACAGAITTASLRLLLCLQLHLPPPHTRPIHRPPCSPDNYSAQPSSCSRCGPFLTHKHFPKTLTNTQHVRRYASDAPPKSGNNSVLYTGIAAAGLAGGYLYLRGGDSPSGQQGAAPPSAEGSKIPALTGEVNKAFTGGEQGFLSLVLEKSEIVNHNTKKLTFKLPEDDQESGLPVAC